MLDPRFYAEVAAGVRDAHRRIAAALATGDAVDLYLSTGAAGAAITAAIRAETHLAATLVELARAARHATAAEARAVPVPLAPSVTDAPIGAGR